MPKAGEPLHLEEDEMEVANIQTIAALETILPSASALPYAALRSDRTLANSGRTLT